MRRSPTAAIVAGTLAALQLAGAAEPGRGRPGADLRHPDRARVPAGDPRRRLGGLDRGALARGARRARRRHGRAVRLRARRAPRRLGGRHRKRRPGARGRARRHGDHALRRARAGGLRALGGPGRHALRRHLAAGARSTASPAVGAEPFFDPRRPTSGRSRAARTARSGWRPAPRVAFRVAAADQGSVALDSEDTHLRSLLVAPGRRPADRHRAGGDWCCAGAYGTPTGAHALRLGARPRWWRSRRRPTAVPRQRCWPRRRACSSSAPRPPRETRRRRGARRSPTKSPRWWSCSARARSPARALRPPADGHRSAQRAGADPRPRPGRTDLDLVRRDGLRAALRGRAALGRNRARGQALRVRGRPAARREGRRGAPDRRLSRAWPAPACDHQRGGALAFTGRRGAARDLHQRRPRRRPGGALRHLPLARRARRRRRACGSRSAAASPPSRTAPGRPGRAPARAARRSRSTPCRAAATSSAGSSSRAARQRSPRVAAHRDLLPAGEPAPQDRAFCAWIRARSWCRPTSIPPTRSTSRRARTARGSSPRSSRRCRRDDRAQDALEEGLPHAALDARPIRTATTLAYDRLPPVPRPSGHGDWLPARRRAGRGGATASTPRSCPTASTASACAASRRRRQRAGERARRRARSPSRWSSTTRRPSCATRTPNGRGCAADGRRRRQPAARGELSIDAGEWKPVAPADGLVDGQTRGADRGGGPAGGAGLVLAAASPTPRSTSRTFDLRRELGSESTR